MLSFQKMTEVLISRVGGNPLVPSSPSQLERQEIPSDGDVHRQLENVNIPIFKGTTKGEVAESWLEDRHLCFGL